MDTETSTASKNTSHFANAIPPCHPAKALLVDDLSFRKDLAQIVHRLTPNVTLRKDLLQEALIHIWQTEINRPGQTWSWYLQSCRFHLQHYLASGKSIDSLKRSNSICTLDVGSQDDDSSPAEVEDDNSSVLPWVSSREIFSLLHRNLSSESRAVLDCLADGMGTREIGRKLSLSHTTVGRHRRKIATLLTQFEVPGAANSLQNFRTCIEPKLRAA